MKKLKKIQLNKYFYSLVIGMLLSSFVLANGSGHGYYDQRLEKLENMLKQSAQDMRILTEEMKALKAQQASQSSTGSSLVPGDDLLSPNSFLQNFIAAGWAENWREYVKMGGFLHSAFTHINGENGDAAAFNRLRLAIYLQVKFNERLNAFAGLDFSSFHNTETAFANNREKPEFGALIDDSELQLAWFTYIFNQYANLRVGRFFSPHLGRLFDEHSNPIEANIMRAILDPENPQMIRPIALDTVFPVLLQGAQIFGSKQLTDNHELLYTIYVGDQSRNADDLNRGIRVAHRWKDPAVTFGLNYFEGDRDGPTSDNFRGYGIDLLYERDKFFLTAKAFKTEENTDRGAVPEVHDRLAYYVQPAYRIKPYWVVFYRYDFLNNGQRVGNVKEHVFGTNFFLNKNIVLRYILTKKDFEASATGGVPGSNAWLHQLSATAFF